MPSALVLTAIQQEYLAVRKHLTDLSEVVSDQGDIYESGVFHGRHHHWRVMIAQTGPLQASASATSTRSINYWKPDVAIFCGVAGGLKDVKIGDVVRPSLSTATNRVKPARKDFK
jgi:nucleoside phosphorylase